MFAHTYTQCGLCHSVWQRGAAVYALYFASHSQRNTFSLYAPVLVWGSEDEGGSWTGSSFLIYETGRG